MHDQLIRALEVLTEFGAKPAVRYEAGETTREMIQENHIHEGTGVRKFLMDMNSRLQGEKNSATP